jgi:hypothetical protein
MAFRPIPIECSAIVLNRLAGTLRPILPRCKAEPRNEDKRFAFDRQPGLLHFVITHFFLTSSVLVLNEMVLVLD